MPINFTAMTDKVFSYTEKMINKFGPRKAGSAEDPFRDFGGYLGTPMGDRNKYYIMSHPEIDYDQLFSAVDQTVDGWLSPGPIADDFADGFDTKYLLSFGPFNIQPGEEFPIVFAYALVKKLGRFLRSSIKLFLTKGVLPIICVMIPTGNFFNRSFSYTSMYIS